MKKLVLIVVLVSGVLLLNGCMGVSSPIEPWGIVQYPLYLLGITVYFLPTIIATARHHRKISSIILLNILAGWTGIGWLSALLWAFSADNKTEE